MPTSLHELQQLMVAAMQRGQDHRTRRGYLGEPLGEGRYRFESAQPRRVRVRLLHGETLTGVVDARNEAVPLNPHIRVVLRRDAAGEWVVIGPDPTHEAAALASGMGAGPHSHRIGFGLEDRVEARRLEPGLVTADGGLWVRAQPFTYRYGGVDRRYPGGVLDLSAHVPATLGAWVWCKIGLDPATNALFAKTGPAVQQPTALTPEALLNISFTEGLPLAGVRLAQGMTALAHESDFEDARLWVVAGVSGSGGSPGVDAPLTPPPASGWNWVNQGGASFSVASVRLHLSAPAVASTSFRLLMRPAPAPPYTLTARLRALSLVDFIQGGLCWRESATGALESLGIQSNNGPALVVDRHSDPFTLVGGQVYARLAGVEWFQFSDDGTERIMRISPDGVAWLEIFRVARTDFLTADEIGLFVNPLNFHGTQLGALLSLYHWDVS